MTDANGDMAPAFIKVVQSDSIVLSTSVITSLICDYDISEAEASGTGEKALTDYAWNTSGVPTVVLKSNNSVSIVQNIGLNFVFFGYTFNDYLI